MYVLSKCTISEIELSWQHCVLCKVVISQRETLQIEFANLMLYLSLVLLSCYSLIVRAYFKFCTSSVLNDAFKFYAKLQICSNILWLTFPTFRTIGSQNLWFSTFYKRPPLAFCVRSSSSKYVLHVESRCTYAIALSLLHPF